MTTSKGGRPPTGRPKWNPSKKVWQARIIQARPDGSKFEKPVDMPGIAEADKPAAQVLAKRLALRAQRIGGVPEVMPKTVNEYADEWLEEREARGNSTVGHDKSRLTRHVLPVIGTKAMVAVEREDIERVVEALDRKILLPAEHAEHLEWKSASNVWVLVTKMFDDAVNAKKRELRVRDTNPAKEVKGPERGEAKAKQYLYPSEFSKLVNFTDEQKIPLRFRTLYAAAVYTFMRAGEIEALTWDDVDLEHGVIHITKAVDRKTSEVKSTKTGETRRIPIEANLRPMLERLNAERPKGSPGSSRVLWLPDDEDRAIKLREHLLLAGAKRAELFITDRQRKNITFHDLRATGITWSAVRGDDPLRIKQRAGHSSFSTTEGYIREAENLRQGFGEPFPELPIELTGGFGMGFGVSGFPTHPSTRNDSPEKWSKGGSNP
jgi:integrase